MFVQCLKIGISALSVRRLLWPIMGTQPWTQPLQEAIALHNAGRLIEAERLYRHVLEIESTQVDALHRLGFLLHQLGKSDEGLVLIRRSLEALQTTHHSTTITAKRCERPAESTRQSPHTKNRLRSRRTTHLPITTSEQRWRAKPNTPPPCRI